jgi:hypothetical protein
MNSQHSTSPNAVAIVVTIVRSLQLPLPVRLSSKEPSVGLSQQKSSFRSRQQRTVISTEAAHAFVSSAAEKSASLPPPCPAQHGVLALASALAFALAVGCSFVVIP